MTACRWNQEPLLLLLYTLEDPILLPPLGIERMLSKRNELGEKRRDHEVHDCGDDEREECLVRPGPDKIAYLREIENCDISDNRCLLDQRHDLIAVYREEVLGSLREYDAEEALALRVSKCPRGLELALSYRMAANAEHIYHGAREHQREAHYGYPCTAQR